MNSRKEFLNGQQRRDLFENFKKRIAVADYDVHRNKQICEQLKNTNDLYDIQFLIEVLAQLLKVAPDKIRDTHIFENKFLQFIRELNPDQVPFLTKETKVSQADFSLYEDRVDFFFRDFSKDQVINMARVLEQFFAESHTIVMSHIGDPNLYWFSLDKSVFLQEVLPVLFEANKTPQQNIKFNEPIVKAPVFKDLNPVAEEVEFLTNISKP